MCLHMFKLHIFEGNYLKHETEKNSNQPPNCVSEQISHIKTNYTIWVLPTKRGRHDHIWIITTFSHSEHQTETTFLIEMCQMYKSWGKISDWDYAAFIYFFTNLTRSIFVHARSTGFHFQYLCWFWKFQRVFLLASDVERKKKKIQKHLLFRDVVITMSNKRSCLPRIIKMNRYSLICRLIQDVIIVGSV